MRKLFLSLIALTLSAGLWAETQSVKYIDANCQEQTAYNVTEITNASSTLTAGWYVVLGSDVQTGTLTCNGAVHLILADGAKLTARGDNSVNPGIRVSGGDNKLIIYGQTNQTGQLNALGGGYQGDGGGSGGAGIGGGNKSIGSNITINGGIVLAKGGYGAAGVGGGFNNGEGSNITINCGTVTAYGGENGAGIGGGAFGNGSNITINGGSITAVGGEYVASIGGGNYGAGSNIKVSADCKVFADGNNPPTTEIAHNSDTDLASAFLRARYAFIEIDQTILSELRDNAISAIDEVIAGVSNVIILDFAKKAKNSITNATNRTAITAIKDSAITELEKLVSVDKSALGELGTEKPGTALKVTKGEKEVILYAPDKVEYIIRK